MGAVKPVIDENQHQLKVAGYRHKNLYWYGPARF